jgi:hypothetical protein
MLLRNLCLCAIGCALSISASDVSEIKFSELLQNPVGVRGLALSDKAKTLNGKRVRITGHVALHENAPAGTFLLAPIPVQLHDDHYGLADDLPATTIFVSIPSNGKGTLGNPRGVVTVTGVFHVGNHEEPDGRISTFRIDSDRSLSAKQSKSGFFKSLKRHRASRSLNNQPQ